MTLPIEVVEVLKRAAAHPEGAAALLEGNLESVASLYQVHPARVEQVRSWLGAAALKRECDGLGASGRSARPAAPVAAPKTPERVIAEALVMPNGLELLVYAPVETAATVLGAHPFVIDEARAQLEQGRAAGAIAIPPPRPSSPTFLGRPS